MTFKRPYFRSASCYSQIVGRAGSTKGTVHAGVTLTAAMTVNPLLGLSG